MEHDIHLTLSHSLFRTNFSLHFLCSFKLHQFIYDVKSRFFFFSKLYSGEEPLEFRTKLLNLKSIQQTSYEMAETLSLGTDSIEIQFSRKYRCATHGAGEHLQLDLHVTSYFFSYLIISGAISICFCQAYLLHGFSIYNANSFNKSLYLFLFHYRLNLLTVKSREYHSHLGEKMTSKFA